MISRRRGKFNNKQYTVFVAELSAAQAATYKPVLNYEHREWRWFPASVAAALPNLHPVVDLLFSPALRSQVDPSCALQPCSGCGIMSRMCNISRVFNTSREMFQDVVPVQDVKHLEKCSRM